MVRRFPIHYVRNSKPHWGPSGILVADIISNEIKKETPHLRKVKCINKGTMTNYYVLSKINLRGHK